MKAHRLEEGQVSQICISYLKEFNLLQKFIDSRWFALSEVLLVLASGLILYLWPSVGGWSLILLLLPWCLRLISGQFPFQRTIFDGFIAIFVLTAAIGYWAAYDENAAMNKFWLILLAVLFYYALSRQPKENLGWLAGIFFSISVGVSIYFFLTHDFVALPRKLQVVNNIGLWIMHVRPQIVWKPIHPNYVSGIAAITAPFGFYPLWKSKNEAAKNPTALYAVMFLSFMLIAFTIFMATSRGVILAMMSAAGSWVVWRVACTSGNNFRLKQETIFPILVLGYLAIVVLLLYAGPASFTGSVISQSNYGTGTRAELFRRSLYFLREFPFTGAGLNAFPGLYSYYMLGVPFFYLPNSHNLFLDVAIEQGILAGLLYLFMFLGSVWFVSRSIIKAPSAEILVFSWLVLFALIISIVHGMVDDYLYNGNGSLLALFLIGTSLFVKRAALHDEGFVAQFDYRITGAVVALFVGVCLFNFNAIRSAWYADLGAVQMTRVELAGFPTNQWTDIKIVPQLKTAETSLYSALLYDRNNETANYRLGLISMLRQNYAAAAVNLAMAYKEVPDNRGIIKNLGYCYLWLGEMDKAKPLLEQIPEAREELGIYSWWWKTQNRADLADHASMMLSQLKISPST